MPACLPLYVPVKHLSRLFFILTFFAGIVATSYGQSKSLSVSSCPQLDKRSNGNGQAALAAGIFTIPQYLNNPVAPNVEGTSYQNVPFDYTTKTGNFHLLWTSATAVTNLPVITRVWITPTGSNTAVLSPITFGPPTPASAVGQKYYVDYAFYVQNMPPAGKVTVEFTDPQTGIPAFTCTYDLQSGGSASTPDIICSPTITTQPANQSVCGSGQASFSVAATGAVSIKWQVNSNNMGWADLSNGSNYAGVTSTTMTVTNPLQNNGNYYRAVLTGGSGCGTTTTIAALLIARPMPTASFATSSLCGSGTQSLAVNLTGTAPWSITYSSGSGNVTKSNISSSPFYLSVSGGTYTITSVSDAYCTNSSPTGTVTATFTAAPSVSPSNATSCYGSSSFNLSYTSSGTPVRYSLTAGVRAMPGFTAVSNAVLTASPASISIPSSGVTAGVYDFNLVVYNSNGCVSSATPFTVTVAAPPSVSATAGSGSVCVGSVATLTAAPAGLASYSWSTSSDPTVLGTGMTFTPTVNATTTYKVTGTDGNGCSAVGTVTVTAVAGPSLSISPSAPSICNGSATVLTASGGNTYAWSPSTGLSATSGDAVVATPSVTTVYTVTSQNLTGCQSVGTVTVTVNAPEITVTPDASICSGSTKTLTASGGSTYVWYPVAGLYTDPGATTTYTGTSSAVVYAKPSATTKYYVVGTTAGGCSSTAGTTVTISTAPINKATSVGNSFTFCSQSVNSISFPVNVTEPVNSMTWAYSSSSGGPYTTFTGSTSVTPYTLTSSSTGATNATFSLSGITTSGYSGPR